LLSVARQTQRPLHASRLGDFIVIINASVACDRCQSDRQDLLSGYPGGITATNFRDMQNKFPGRALEKSRQGMLQRPLGYAMIKNSRCMAA
jgi:large subunit ribosomal protein L13